MMTRDVTVSITVPGRGSRPSRYRFSWTPPPEEYDPPQQFRALVTDVPDSVSPVSIQQALQLVVDVGLGVNTPCRFGELRSALERAGYQFTGKDSADDA